MICITRKRSLWPASCLLSTALAQSPGILYWEQCPWDSEFLKAMGTWARFSGFYLNPYSLLYYFKKLQSHLISFRFSFLTWINEDNNSTQLTEKQWRLSRLLFLKFTYSWSLLCSSFISVAAIKMPEKKSNLDLFQLTNPRYQFIIAGKSRQEL